jgi:hypothetical protein
MFSLIITIISIALVTALALATIYYGGSAFRQGGDAAAAARFINEGQQLSGAAAVAESTGVTITAPTVAGTPDANGITALSTAKLLQSAPAGWVVDSAARAFSVPTVPAAACTKVNEKAGLAAAGTFTAVAAGAITNYGCVQATATTDGQMVFKY